MQQHRTFHSSIVLVVVCLLGSLVLAACGSNSSSNTSQTSAKALKVGVLLPLTGQNAGVGTLAKHGIELAYEENSKNPANRKLELQIEDCGATKEDAVNAYNRLISKGKPDIMIMGANSVQATSLSPLIKADGIPSLVNLASNPQLSQQGNDWLFFTRTLDDTGAAFATQFLTGQLKKKKVAIIHSNDEVGFAMVAIYLSSLRKENVEPVMTLSVPIDSTDYTAAIEQIKSKEADVLLAWTYTVPAQAIVKQVRKAGLNIPIVGSVAFGLSATIKSLTPDELNEVYAVTDALPVASTDPTVQAFVKNFQQRSNGSDPDGLSLVSYDSLNLIQWVANQGVTDPQSVRKTLQTVKNYKGLKGQYTYNPKDGRLSNTTVLINDNKGKPIIAQEIQL